MPTGATGCHGNGEEHCCYLPGTGIKDPRGTGQDVCPFLEVDTLPDRHWVCGAARVLGSWDSVHRSTQYNEKVWVVFEKLGVVAKCGDWRVEGQCCFSPNNPPIYNIGE